MTTHVQAGNDHPHGQEREKDRDCEEVEGAKQGTANEYVGIKDIEYGLDGC